MKEHPDADKSLHSVKKTEKKAPAKKEQLKKPPEHWMKKFWNKKSKASFNRGTAEQAEKLHHAVELGHLTMEEADKALDYMVKHYKVDEKGWGNIVQAEDAVEKGAGVSMDEIKKRQGK